MGKGKKTDSEKLTDLEERMCHAFVENGGDQSAALVSCHKSAKNWQPQSIWVKASQIFSKNKVQIRISELRNKISEELQMTTMDLVRERENLIKVTAADFYDEHGELIPIHLLPPHVAKAIQSWDEEQTIHPKTGAITKTYKVKLYSRDVSMTMREKQLGMYEKDNIQKADKSFSFNVNFVSASNKGGKK